MSKLVLIDGNSLAYRAFFALPLLSNDRGLHTNAIYGFTTILMKMIEEEKPTHVLVAFDAGKTTFRHETYKEYKGGRAKTPGELSEQFPFIRQLIESMNMKWFELDRFEGDDIIGTMTKQMQGEEEVEVIVYSGDKDLLQLVDEHVSVCVTRKGISELDIYTVEAIKDKYGLSPEKIIDMKGLMGDKSDNIPGVPGIGEKTALKLLHEFGSIEAVLENIEQISGKKLKENLQNYKEDAILSKKLATIFRDVPLPLSFEDLKYDGYDKETLLSFFREMDFNSLIERISNDKQHTVTEKEQKEWKYEKVTAIEDKHLQEEAALVVEVEKENYHDAAIRGFALKNKEGLFFIPTDVALASEPFLQWLQDESKKKWVFDAKKEIVALHWKKAPLKGINFDVLLASYVLNPAETKNDLADIAPLFQMTDVEHHDVVYGKGAKRHLPGEDVIALHTVKKAATIYALKEKMIARLRENEQLSLLNDLEIPLSTILAKMEEQGVCIDTEILKQMGKELDERLEEIEKQIHELAGVSFNINSPKQLGEILFEKLQLPVIKKTKTGYSTSADVLEKLQHQHEIIPLIFDYRQLGKLNSTYVEGLLKEVNTKTGHIHTRFNQALTQTGRLSSTDPNLQNIPIRIEEGRKIRKAFVPSEPDWMMFAADYSQIELRVLAHMSQDERLIAAFKQGMDIHTKTAMDVFHVSEGEVTPLMRRQAKAVNFGIVYGISDYGLSQNLGIPRKEAADFITRYFEIFKGVKIYMEEIVQVAKEQGYVTTLLHRRRYIPDIHSRNFNIRSFAERTAMNTPIQGSAADIIKKAMIEMDQCLEREGLRARLLLQVHDELIFEAPEDEIEKLKIVVPEVMEQAVQLDVPLKVDYDFGPSWYDAK
ncbi:DNA polymerase I [Massilibacterium senegalense]|uniref:DNA polymerase I n=1 Tax=Massilibacterium senegalense TaxID=1632858 RepID=UPI000783E74E|nr:DNA polymerase I [Massilibacterium senegalense]